MDVDCLCDGMYFALGAPDSQLHVSVYVKILKKGDKYSYCIILKSGHFRTSANISIG
jgi:hypothetical protein